MDFSYFNLNRKIIFDLSYATFFKAVIILLVLAFLYLVRDLLLMIFVAIVIASGVDPWIDFLQKKKIPRAIGVLFIFALLLGSLVLIVSVLVPPIIDQVQQLIQILPQYFNILLEQIGKNAILSTDIGNIEEFTKSISGRLGNIVGNIYGAISNVFGALLTIIIIFVLAFYFVVEEDNFKKFIRSITPTRHRPYVDDLVGRIQVQMGRWLRGQLTLGLAVGIMVFIGLTLLDVKYALILALLAALLEIVPYIGPIVAAIPAVFLGLTQSPLTGLLVVALYVAVQQLENHLLVPKIMGKTLGLNPLVIILVILVGGKLAGILGAILAVPIATAVHVFITDLFEARNRKEKEKLRKEICKPGPEEEKMLTRRERKYQKELRKEICPVPKKKK